MNVIKTGWKTSERYTTGEKKSVPTHIFPCTVGYRILGAVHYIPLSIHYTPCSVHYLFVRKTPSFK